MNTRRISSMRFAFLAVWSIPFASLGDGIAESAIGGGIAQTMQTAVVQQVYSSCKAEEEEFLQRAYIWARPISSPLHRVFRHLRVTTAKKYPLEWLLLHWHVEPLLKGQRPPNGVKEIVALNKVDSMSLQIIYSPLQMPSTPKFGLLPVDVENPFILLSTFSNDRPKKEPSLIFTRLKLDALTNTSATLHIRFAVTRQGDSVSNWLDVLEVYSLANTSRADKETWKLVQSDHQFNDGPN